MLSYKYWHENSDESFEGNSAFFTRFNVNIQEGYKIGASRYLVDLGNYRVSGFDYGGNAKEVLNLQLESPVSEASISSMIMGRQYLQNYQLFDDFNDNSSLTKYSTSGNDFGVSNGTLRVSFREDPNGEFTMSPSNTEKKLSDIKIENSVYTESTAGFGGSLLVGINFRTQEDGNGYQAFYEKNSSIVGLKRFSSVGETILGSTSIGISLYKSFALKVWAIGSNITVSGSTNKSTFNKFISANDSTFKEGSVSSLVLRNGVSVGNEINNQVSLIYSYLSVDEVGTRWFSDDIVSDVFTGTAKVGVSIESKIDYFTGFTMSSGSSWILSNNNSMVTRVSSGTSWDRFYSGGGDFSDEMFECEVNGMSGTQVGIMVGSGLIGYCTLGGATADFRAVHYSGSTLANINEGSPIVKLLPNQWNKLRIIARVDKAAYWYLNNQFINSTRHLVPSSTALTGDLVSYGVAVSSVSGACVSFRNPRISILPSYLESLSVDSNRNPSELLSAITQGFNQNWSGDAINIFRMGSSRGNLGVTYPGLLVSSSQSISNNIANIGTISIQGTNVIRASQGISSYRGRYQADKTIVIASSSSSSLNTPSADNIIYGQLLENTVGNANTLSITTIANPLIEKGDKLKILNAGFPRESGDSNSDQYLVLDHSRSFNSERGTYTHNIIVGKI